MEDRIQSRISLRSVFLEITIGAKSAVQPTIISVLKILLPTTFPMAMSALPFRAEETLTVSSGRKFRSYDGEADNNGRDAGSAWRWMRLRL